MVQGVAEFNKKFNKVPKLVALYTTEAMEKGADEIVAMMRRLVPRRSSVLANSINWTWGNAPSGAVTLAKSKSAASDPKGARITIYAGSRAAFYAPFVEFGTRQNTAQPFFFPSYRAMKKRVRSRINRAIKKGIKDGLR